MFQVQTYFLVCPSPTLNSSSPLHHTPEHKPDPTLLRTQFHPLPHHCWPSTPCLKPCPDFQAPGLHRNPRPNLPGKEGWIIPLTLPLQNLKPSIYLICPIVAIALLSKERMGSPTTNVTSLPHLWKRTSEQPVPSVYTQEQPYWRSLNLWAGSTIQAVKFSSPFLVEHFQGSYWIQCIWCLVEDTRLYLRYIQINTPLYIQPLSTNT